MRGFLLGLLASLSVGCGLFQIDKDLSVTSGTGGDGTTATAGSGGSNTGGSGGGGVTTTTEALKPLVFEMSGLNEGRIVLGGDPEWQSFGSYTITNPNDVDITLDSVTLTQISDGGDAADFVNVGVNHDPTVLGECSLALDTQTCLLSLAQNLPSSQRTRRQRFSRCSARWPTSNRTPSALRGSVAAQPRGHERWTGSHSISCGQYPRVRTTRPQVRACSGRISPRTKTTTSSSPHRTTLFTKAYVSGVDEYSLVAAP